MQAKLPDINSALVRHRTGALAAMSQLNYSLAATELNAMNSLLPQKYKVKGDDEEYYNIIQSQDVMLCNQCNKETNYNSITFYNASPDLDVQLLYKVDKIAVWECSHCHNVNPKDGSDRIIRQKERPFYTGYIPNPPKKGKFGNTMGFKFEFEKWFDIALNEIEKKVADYRTDYAAQSDEDLPEFDDEDDNNGNT